jgi:hypothetical protein
MSVPTTPSTLSWLTGHSQISTIGNYVILCDSTGISLWMIPPLYPCSSPLANQVQDIEPHYRCGTGTTLGPDAIYDFDPLSDWYHGMNQPFILDVNIFVNATFEQNRHLLEFPILSKDRSPAESPIKVHKRFQILFPEDEGYLEDYRVSDGHVVQYWSAKSGLNIQTSPVDAAGEDMEIQSVSVAYKMPLVDRYQSTLCSASGRMCRVLGSMIEIVDFLEPPWPMSYD